MTDKELYNEYRSSDCKTFTDFLINKIAELEKENAEFQHKIDTLQGFLDRDVEFDNLQKENADLKAKYDTCLRENTGLKIHSAYVEKKLANAKEIIKLLLWDLRNRSYEPVKDIERAEQFLKNDGCPDVMCEDCTKEDCGVRQLGLVEVKK